MALSSIRFVFVSCADCGAEVDRVEYDDAPTSAAVAAVVAALGIDDAAAVKLVKRNNPGAELTSEQNARALAELIAARAVDDRAAETYACPNGHDGELVVSDDNPTPAVATMIAKEAAR